MLAADDVIDLVRKAGAFLVHQTIFTASTGPLGNEQPRTLVDVMRH